MKLDEARRLLEADGVNAADIQIGGETIEYTDSERIARFRGTLRDGESWGDIKWQEVPRAYLSPWNSDNGLEPWERQGYERE